MYLREGDPKVKPFVRLAHREVKKMHSYMLEARLIAINVIGNSILDPRIISISSVTAWPDLNTDLDIINNLNTVNQ